MTAVRHRQTGHPIYLRDTRSKAAPDDDHAPVSGSPDTNVRHPDDHATTTPTTEEH